MRTGLLWDIFCTVIDNHGDLGVCWRLSRQLLEAGHRVRLWVDDASALTWMAPDAHHWPGLELRPWAQASLPGAPPPGQGTGQTADVWIEAFGCEIPEAFVARHVHQHSACPRHTPPPVWINLEYLSAEDWVPRMHGLPSPVMSGPARGWTKWFFYPGFSPGTGGLLRETGLLARQQHFDRQAWRQRHAPGLAPGGRLMSLFCYEPAGLPALLQQLAPGPDHLLVTPGRPLSALEQALAGMRAQPHWSALPYTDQDGFDEMLWACDLNFVRGEDSLVRALWAGQPLVWHIYPQHDNAHHAKLEAFLEALQAPQSLRQFHRVWNGIAPGPAPALTPDTLSDWARAVQAARQRWLQQPDLTQQLTGWVQRLRQAA